MVCSCLFLTFLPLFVNIIFTMYQYQENLPPEAKLRYKRKLETTGITQCPYKEPADRWCNDPKQWPPTTYKDVYHYLIKSPRIFSPEAMENYRSLEAHTFFVSGWVQTVYHLKTDSGNFILKADVRPSWRVTEEPHHPWVAVRKDGQVIAAHCDCMAGLGETCSHIGATSFKMEAAVRLGYTSATCTDIPCEWNQCFTKNVKAARISAINFYKQSAKEKLKSSQQKGKPLPQPSTVSDQMKFLDGLSALKTNSVGLSTFKEHCEPFIGLGPKPNTNKQLPPSLHELFKEDNTSLSQENLLDLCARTAVTVTKERIDYVEEVTRNQSLSTTWHNMRVGRITASVRGEIITRKGQNPPISIVKKICVPQNRPLRVPAIEWGNEHEEYAFKLYTFIHHQAEGQLKEPPSGHIYLAPEVKMNHIDGTTTKVGLCIHPEKTFIGASPDGMTECSCCGKGVLEIKCPYKYRDTGLDSVISLDKSFCLSDTYALKANHKYFAQV
ncbi:uncharacterized protein LOC125660689 [Ostrea edulis]|uniref:uncharacterized protein LOC125660689 n=1 Tax=Ostrea edulis TaxID=37623 RepID=UPI0024AEB1E3|nr:uncharacterized protein LOC125660689 [Ostrea edulis]